MSPFTILLWRHATRALCPASISFSIRLLLCLDKRHNVASTCDIPAVAAWGARLIDTARVILHLNSTAYDAYLHRLCIDDCTTALTRLEEAMSGSTAGSSASASTELSSMVKLLTRRAAAYVEVHDMQHAQADIQEVSQNLINHHHAYT